MCESEMNSGDQRQTRRSEQRPSRTTVRLSADPGRRGSALAATLIVFVGVTGLVLASSQLSGVEVTASRRSIDKVRATAIAEAGIEQNKAMLADAVRKNSISSPLDGVRALFPQGAGSTRQTFDAEPLMDGAANVGEYTTSMTFRQDGARRVLVTITSTGYIPRAPQNLGPKEKLQAWDSIEVTVEYTLKASEVFDNAYFVNNWGWLYGNTIEVNGNARSNGQMDIGGYQPIITGQPLFDSATFDGTSASLGDAVDGEGLSSGWDIVNADRVRDGQGGSPDKRDFQDQVEMPNLTDLSRYEEMATTESSSITIGGVVVSDGITGDEGGEKKHLYLHGTAANPIVLNGPVVVRGDLIISGYVTGQGTIYSGGNVYVPDSVRYLNGPTSERPSGDSRAETEAWLTQNWNADFLGLFARESIVVGDFTQRSWSNYVNGWLQSPMNSSREDSGLDLIANTRAGRDGIMGTADDDFLEGDGVFTVEHYSADDAAAGLIPDGFSVGDAIPGTGEDIDGDGQYDDTLNVADFAFEDDLESSKWDGNMPSGGIERYSDIASMYANHLDATFYTNHAFAWVVFGSQNAEINGSVVARNESIVYGTPRAIMNYDARLLGGGDGFVGDMLPNTAAPMRVVQWRRLQEDPHRAVVMP
ncbi:hypothetical protein Poly30_20380 [Planctomycetes bacterium Poly30]|uniref:Uncharacterized protein n=1 Tax=Saltatorellus ferox TaxID=2528018 RepID=A0A518ER12_9BACT|nr:hypothetical protein Poly30_20380 [Planctomycetes bacterium Poly30]